MKTMLFKKTLLAALAVALVIAVLPVSSAFAADPTQTPTPPAANTQRLERIWERMQNRYERLGSALDKSDDLTKKAEKMIERLKEAGESTAELEAALAAYESAVKDAHPIYESCKGIINSHKGFDADGKVTDAEQARQTLKDMASKFGAIREAMDGKAKELIDLMKSIRDAHQPPSAPSVPSDRGT